MSELRKAERPPTCRACDSDRVHWKGYFRTKARGIRRRAACQDCGLDITVYPPDAAIPLVRLASESEAQLRAAFAAGKSARATAKALGCNQKTVRRWAAKLGHSFAPRTPCSDVVKLRACFLRCMTAEAAALVAGCHQTTACKWFHRFRAEEHAAFVAAFRARYAPESLRRAA